ncbi:MAG: hypothetical protein QOG85_851 [Gaiellaceae bacterium]|jgi:hypothetical protein|nr:hypothetical protein [Gaiellaceae bacterium]
MTSELLKVSGTLSLPIEAVTETFAVVGKRGTGKTNFGVVLVEELIRAKQPVIVIDPVGVWWGLRLAADGKSPGLDVKIIGGEHADVPLEEGAGRVLAEFVVETRQACVFDLSGLRKGAQVRFMTDFAEALYHQHASKREALHVVVDEADAYAPQNAGPDAKRLLGAMEDLIRRGRSRGIGMTLITQRPAVLNKNVLTQAEVLVVFRLTGPHDRAAADDWIRGNADDETQRKIVEAELPGLPRGDAFVWSPGWLDVFKRVTVRRRATFDSSATPKPGQRAKRRELPPVDLEALRARIADTIERAKLEDPKVLRGRVSELEREIGKLKAAPTISERVEVVPEVLLRAVAETIRRLTEALAAAELAGAKVTKSFAKGPNGANGRVVGRLVNPRGGEDVVNVGTKGMSGAAPAVHVVFRGAAPAAAEDLPRAQRKILTALAQAHPSPLSRVQLAVRTGYTHDGGGFRNSLGALKTAQHIDGDPNGYVLTSEGRRALGSVEPLPSGRALLDYWMTNAGGKAERLILGELADVHPRTLTPAALANRVGYEGTGGGFRNALGRLRTLQLVKGRVDVGLTPMLAEVL